MYLSFNVNSQQSKIRVKKKKNKLSKVDCQSCQHNKEYCNRYLPSCQRCYDIKVQCNYSLEEGDTVINTNVDFKSFRLEFNELSQSVIYWRNKKDKPIKNNSKRNRIDYNDSLPSISQFRVFKNKSKVNLPKNIFTNWRNIAVVRLILRSSYLDTDKSPIYFTKNKGLEYYGQSPMGGLLAIYYDLNQDLNKSATNQVSVNSTAFNLKVIQLQDQLIDDSIFNECAKAYFEYYARFTPIIDEYSLQENPSRIIKCLIAGVGAKYLPKGESIPGLYEYLDQQILIQFKQQFPKPTIDLVKCLLIMCQFQNVPSEFKNTWIYHGYAVSLATTLGLNKPLPKSFNLTQRQRRMRCHVWWILCIHDKIAYHFTNRPILIPGELDQPYPQVSNLPKLSNDKADDEFIIAREYISSTFLKAYTELTELLGHVHGCINVRFPNNPNNSFILGKKLLFKISTCYDTFLRKMNNLLKNQPKWTIELATPLIAQLFCLMNAMVIRLCQYFLKYKDHSDYKGFLLRALFSARLIIVSVESLGPYFFRCGVAYLFYAISAACLFFAHCLRCGNNVRLAAKDGLKRGLKLIAISRPYFAICEEFYAQIMDIVGDEHALD